MAVTNCSFSGRESMCVAARWSASVWTKSRRAARRLSGGEEPLIAARREESVGRPLWLPARLAGVWARRDTIVRRAQTSSCCRHQGALAWTQARICRLLRIAAGLRPKVTDSARGARRLRQAATGGGTLLRRALGRLAASAEGDAASGQTRLVHRSRCRCRLAIRARRDAGVGIVAALGEIGSQGVAARCQASPRCVAGGRTGV